MTRTLPAGDFAIGDDRTTRARRPCVAPALHVPGDGIPQHVHDRPTVVRRAEERADRDADLRELAAYLAPLLKGDDEQARLHQARDFVTAVALTAAANDEPFAPRIGDATTTVHRALLGGGVDRSTATHFTRLVIDALDAGDHIR